MERESLVLTQIFGIVTTSFQSPDKLQVLLSLYNPEMSLSLRFKPFKMLIATDIVVHTSGHLMTNTRDLAPVVPCGTFRPEQLTQKMFTVQTLMVCDKQNISRGSKIKHSLSLDYIHFPVSGS